MSVKEKLKNIFQKEKAWDSGSDDDDFSEKTVAEYFLYGIMALYGAVAGFFGCQYLKYLHQRFACKAWGIPLTSRPLSRQSPMEVVVDVVAFGLVYAAVLAIGALLNALLNAVFAKQIGGQLKEVRHTSLMYGFIAVIISSIVMFFVHWNIFLIGVP